MSYSRKENFGGQWVGDLVNFFRVETKNGIELPLLIRRLAIGFDLLPTKARDLINNYVRNGFIHRNDENGLYFWDTETDNIRTQVKKEIAKIREERTAS